MENKVIYPIQHTAKHAHIYELAVRLANSVVGSLKHKISYNEKFRAKTI